MNKALAIIFANLKGNLGDFAILHAMLVDIRNKYPDYNIHVYPHGFHSIDQVRFKRFQDLINIKFLVPGTTYSTKLIGEQFSRILRATRLWPYWQDYQIEKFARTISEDAVKFKVYEHIFIAGGAQWGGTQTATSMFATLSAIYQHNKNILSFPFSVTPKISKLNNPSALRRYFDKIRDPIIVRDISSKQVMDGLSIKTDHTADCVYSLRSEVQKIRAKPQNRNRRILLSLTNGNGKKIYNDLDNLISRSGNFKDDITLITTCEREDSESYKRIASEYEINYLAPNSWQDLVAEIKNSDLFITNRLHGLILSSLSSIPVLPVTNRKKADSYVKDVGLNISLPNLEMTSEKILQSSLDNSKETIDKINLYLGRTSQYALSPLTIDTIKNI